MPIFILQFIIFIHGYSPKNYCLNSFKLSIRLFINQFKSAIHIFLFLEFFSMTYVHVIMNENQNKFHFRCLKIKKIHFYFNIRLFWIVFYRNNMIEKKRGESEKIHFHLCLEELADHTVDSVRVVFIGNGIIAIFEFQIIHIDRIPLFAIYKTNYVGLRFNGLMSVLQNYGLIWMLFRLRVFELTLV